MVLKMRKLILPLLLLTMGFSQTLSAEIYKWTDKEGKVHYSSTPPKVDPQKAQLIGDKIKANIGKVQPKTTYKSATDTAKPVKNTKKVDDPYKNDRSAARIKYCTNLKNNITTLQNNKNVDIVVEGKPSALSSTQKDERLNKYQSDLEKNCKDI